MPTSELNLRWDAFMAQYNRSGKHIAQKFDRLLRANQLKTVRVPKGTQIRQIKSQVDTNVVFVPWWLYQSWWFAFYHTTTTPDPDYHFSGVSHGMTRTDPSPSFGTCPSVVAVDEWHGYKPEGYF